MTRPLTGPAGPLARVLQGNFLRGHLPLPGGSQDEAKEQESKQKKSVKRSNSFSRRKNKGKGDEAGGTTEDGYSGDSDALQKPAFKLEAQQDPLREALQQEAGATAAHGRPTPCRVPTSCAL